MDACVKKYITDDVALYCGDTCDLIRDFGDESMHFIIFSPPFNSLFVYSNSDRDLGNSKNDKQFFEHFHFITTELYRILKPGRIMAVHCMNLPTTKEKDGYIGIKDFRGDLIREFQSVGFIYHSEVCIWKNPVVAMQRTKALGLLHKQVKKDSAMSRMGLPDYVVFMRKPGDNPVPITHTNETYPVSKWQVVAEPTWCSDIYPDPTWMDINQSDTLNKMFSDEESERHIAPLQLCLIERVIDLYSDKDSVILTPFLGIGSEVYQAVKMGRKAYGFELKKEYYEQAVKNLQTLDDEKNQMTIFDYINQE